MKNPDQTQNGILTCPFFGAGDPAEPKGLNYAKNKLYNPCLDIPGKTENQNC